MDLPLLKNNGDSAYPNEKYGLAGMVRGTIDKVSKLYKVEFDWPEGVWIFNSQITAQSLSDKRFESVVNPECFKILIVADHRYVNQDKNYYNYTVVYMDPDHNEKTTETYLVANPKESYVGKRCTVYVSEGKAIVDAIER